MAKLLDLLIGAADRARHVPSRSALEVGDLEDAVAERLQLFAVSNPWDLAPALVAAGLDEEWVDQVVACMGDASPSALRWIALGLDVDSLVGEIRSSAGRISELVAAMKGYTHIDAGPFAAVDVHDGLDSTLVILSHKLKGGVEVVRDYDRTIPKIEARAGELNQVWTNLIDNAVGAMGGVGTLTLRTRRDGEWVDVEVGDTGPGVPPELRRRIFEPFFTTKEVGQGTGLGLDISFRIVARRHHGNLSVESVPGDTRFRVRLPIKQP
jgi:signal transduction histidine kinase